MVTSRLAGTLTIFAAAIAVAATPVVIASPVQAKSVSAKKLPSGVSIKRIKRGKGPPPSLTDTVLINYEMTVPTSDNPVGDDTSDATATESETIKGVWQAVPVGQAMTGLGRAIGTMQKGGRYRVTLSPDQAFGEYAPTPAISSGGPLTMTVELLDFVADTIESPIGSMAKDTLPDAAQLRPDVIKYAVNQPGVMTQPSGLKYKVLSAGDGERPDETSTVLIGYEGRLLNGKVFDSNARTSFPVAGVVPGFGEALQLMQKGGRYRIWIPPALGYGERGAGDSVPANAWLVFDVEMFDFISEADLQKLQAGAAAPE